MTSYFPSAAALSLPLGEVWAVHGDLRVANGLYAGQVLDDLWKRFPLELSGTAAADGCFPLLVKWLDTSDWLSVQVHPDDEQARLLEGRPDASGKVECWYILSTADEGELICGCNTEEDVQQIASLSGKELLAHLHRQRVRPGDFLFLPAGTIHALGPGITLLEVQQSSDLTYRFYDWDRTNTDGAERPLHIAKARQAWLHSQRIGSHSGWRPRTALGELLTANTYFAQEVVEGSGSWCWDIDGLEIVAVLRGRCQALLGEASAELAAGGVALFPAAAKSASLSSLSENVQFVRIMCPARAGLS